MTYEEYLTEFKPIMVNMCKKYNYLNMEYEDKMQECYLLLLSKMEELEEKESIEHKRKYFKACLNGHFANINIKEHEQCLRHTISYNSKRDEFDDEKIDILIANDIEQNIQDPFLERIYQVRKDNLKRWKKNNKEHCREYHRKYREKHKDEIRDYYYEWQRNNRRVKTLDEDLNSLSVEQIKRILKYKEEKKKYYKKNKEELDKKNKKYYEEHKEEIKEYKKKYYQEHKEEINKKRKEKRQLEKEQKKNGQ